MDNGKNTSSREDRKSKEYVASQMWFGGNDLLTLLTIQKNQKVVYSDNSRGIYYGNSIT